MEKTLYNSINKKDSYNLWMAYPACEAFALASLGFMWLYKLAEENPLINAELVCTDTERARINPSALAFSMSFDFDFMGVFELLEKYNIPFLSKDRDENQPLIFAGGPVLTTNPEPYKNIFDFMIIGDGEIVFDKVLNLLAKNLSKQETLLQLLELEGVYVPNLTKKVKKITEKITSVIYTPVISEKSYFKDTFIIEVARGCMNRCAFCTASYLNLPFRHYEYEKIIDVIDLGLKHTNKIALLGAQISAHQDFLKIMDYHTASGTMLIRLPRHLKQIAQDWPS